MKHFFFFEPFFSFAERKKNWTNFQCRKLIDSANFPHQCNHSNMRKYFHSPHEANKKWFSFQKFSKIIYADSATEKEREREREIGYLCVGLFYVPSISSVNFSEHLTFGDPTHLNLGVCAECSFKQTRSIQKHLCRCVIVLIMSFTIVWRRHCSRFNLFSFTPTAKFRPLWQSNLFFLFR